MPGVRSHAFCCSLTESQNLLRNMGRVEGWPYDAAVVVVEANHLHEPLADSCSSKFYLLRNIIYVVILESRTNRFAVLIATPAIVYPCCRRGRLVLQRSNHEGDERCPAKYPLPIAPNQARSRPYFCGTLAPKWYCSEDKERSPVSSSTYVWGYAEFVRIARTHATLLVWVNPRRFWKETKTHLLVKYGWFNSQIMELPYRLTPLRPS